MCCCCGGRKARRLPGSTSGGLVDPGEDPWTAAVRELREETGLVPAGPLTMIGCYPMFVYGQTMLQLSFRCAVDGDAVELSHEHTDMLWLDPHDTAAFLTPEARAAISDGNPAVDALLESIAAYVGRYLHIVDGEGDGGNGAGSEGLVGDE